MDDIKDIQFNIYLRTGVEKIILTINLNIPTTENILNLNAKFHLAKIKI